MIKTLIFFRPNRCSVSQNMIPTVYEAYNRYREHYSLRIINVDREPEAIARYNLDPSGWPQYMILCCDEEAARLYGFRDLEMFSEWLEEHKDLTLDHGPCPLED